MKQLVVLRHAQRQDTSNNLSHLSRAGVDQARRMSRQVGAFDLVVSSPLPRAIETAIAMGFAVDQEIELLATLAPEVSSEVRWDAGYAAWAQALKRGGETRAYALQLLSLADTLLSSLPDGGTALVLTHGGIVEALAVAAASNANHASWGGAAGYCEGVRLTLQKPNGYTVELLRLGGTAPSN